MRTSTSHPLRIAELEVGRGFGRIGVTFCPGKKDNAAMTGGWDRDLALDLEAVRERGTAAVVTLIEDHEFEMLQVSRLGEEIARRHMSWLHLPIADVATPEERFEETWNTAGEELRSILRHGFDVLVHCRGGLGRAGMIAARLLAEFGVPPEDAIARVRKARGPDAIETRAQENVVRGARPIPQRMPDTDVDAIRDRAVGSLVGLAVGDAVGTTLEFKARDSHEPLRDMVGGGPFRLAAGHWTDDTAMALALADSLIEKGKLDETDLMTRFMRWRDHGEYSCTGDCFDIGTTTRLALDRSRRTGNPISGPTAPDTAGNGSLMRLAPVAIRYWNERHALRDAAARQSRTTHGAPEAVDACVAFSEMLADAISGRPPSAVLGPRNDAFAGNIGPIMAGSWRGKSRAAINASGYVAHTLEAAIWSLARTPDSRDAILLAANLGEDADTTAAVAGQLAGAMRGLNALPVSWKERVAWGSKIGTMANQLFDASLR